MLRRVAVVGSTAVFVLAGVTVSSAEARNAGAAPNHFISGAFVDNAVAGSSEPCADGFPSTHVVTYGEGNAPPASGTSVVSICSHGGFYGVVTGTFVTTANNGATLVGTVSGTADPSGFSGSLTVTGGTKQFSNVTGTIDYVGVPAGPATFTGTLTPHLSHGR